MEDSFQDEIVSEEEASSLRLYAIALFEQRQRQVTICQSGVGIREIGPIPALRTAFYTILKRYNLAMAENLIKLHRHECSLRAWSLVLSETDMPQEVMLPLFWDYIEPVLFMALDLPSAVKDQVIRAAVSLKALAVEGAIGLNKVTAWDDDRNFRWLKHFADLDDGSDEFIALREAVDRLWKPDQAKELRDDHGRRHHAIAQRVGVGFPKIVNTTKEGDDGLSFAYGRNEPLDLGEKLQLIESQRLMAELAYDAFWDYVKHLEICGLEM